jgi:2-oxoglutarate ferredoxin oxidoreductase subunit delta
MEAVKTIEKLKIKQDFCKECGLCVNICPNKALKFSNKFNVYGYHPVKLEGECNACGLCFLVCPDNAIEIKED